MCGGVMEEVWRACRGAMEEVHKQLNVGYGRTAVAETLRVCIRLLLSVADPTLGGGG